MLKDGDTAATRERFLRRLTGKGVPAAEALRIGIERRKVLEAGGLLLAPGAAYLERDLHQHLERLRAAAPGFALSKDLRVREAVEAAERDARLPLTEEQRTAVRVLLQQRVGLLQGGAGTGKTTSMRVLVAAWRRLGGRVEAMALSGKAASKLAQSTSMDALTIAQALKRLHERAELEEAGEIGPSDDGPARGDGAPMRRLPRFTPGTLLLIDEASMVDVSSLRRLVQHVPGGASLLLVGDVAQLPPIGLGQVFHDLVHAEEGVVELTRTLRQDEGNPLRDVAAAIRAGRAPALPRFSGAAAGVQLEECAARDVEARLAAVRARLAVEAPADDILVVAARNSTVRSVCRGEMARRQAEGATGVRVGPLCAWVAEGDPVVMGANHYRFGLSNGQLGRVVGLDPLEVAWDGEGDACAVDDSCKADIMSAWAVTCHKSQGSEAARVAVALDSTTMLTRQWLYTSVTRARRQAVLVGPRELLDAAVARLSGRMTGFALLARGGTGSA
jgi:exodeoxyribonuclease V alpha subunit